MRLAALSFALLLGSACFEETPCDRYVNYLCDCHTGDPEFDCQELLRVYADSDPTLQNQCQSDLATQQQLDDEAGLTCDVG